MRVEFRITSGSRAGQREGFDKDLIRIGRLASNDLKFHPEQDPDVSSNHAEIRIAGNIATLKDLGSTNGTFVNGQRVQGERGLGNGDVITFGEGGPQAEVIAPELARPSAPRRDTSARIAEAVEAQTGTMKKMIGGLAALVVVGVGVAFYLGNQGASKQIAVLIAQNDSLGKLFATLRGKSASLDSALDAEHKRSEDLTRRLEGARKSGDAATVTQLSAEFQNNASRQRGLASAAAVDWQTVNARNAAAMAFIVVDFGDGVFSSGTGFNVHPSGLIVTNRHVVRDEKGNIAKRIVIEFDGETGKFKQTRVIKLSETDELAWLKVEIPGTYPVIQGIARNANARVGAPVALIGYPLGKGTAGMDGDINKMTPSSSQMLGSVSKVLPDILQLDVYAAQGSSGSPVFNADGLVIGVLYGSPTESGGRIIYAVPAAKLVAQMPPEGAAIVR
jgi:pSer/pThr/pTyr-binding forkhead associated (FHA) protein/V8-like Glu-specific endopeptidase